MGNCELWSFQMHSRIITCKLDTLIWERCFDWDMTVKKHHEKQVCVMSSKLHLGSVVVNYSMYWLSFLWFYDTFNNSQILLRSSMVTPMYLDFNRVWPAEFDVCLFFFFLHGNVVASSDFLKVAPINNVTETMYGEEESYSFVFFIFFSHHHLVSLREKAVKNMFHNSWS